jgi:membrane protease YdiL (CAAX protease family)
MTAPPPPNDPPPWTGRDIVIALFFVYGFWLALSSQVLHSSGFFDWLYGPETVALCYPNDKGTEPTPEQQEATQTRVALLAGPIAGQLDVVVREARHLAQIRLGPWIEAAAFLFRALTVPVVFFIFSGVTPGRIGLTTRQLWRNVLAGAGVWVVVAPLVFGINILVVSLYSRIDPDAVQEHQLTRLALQQPTGAEWALLIFTAVVAAPVIEETVFRGALQPWFAGQPAGGVASMVAAFAVSMAMRQAQIFEAIRRHGDGLLPAVMPGLFVLALVPLYALVARHRRRHDAPAVFGTSLLFASMHAAVWPTPVPLFVLGLALGTLASRTGSLVGPIVLHGLFNAITCVFLVMGWVG